MRKYESDFPWAVLSAAKGGVICTTCSEFCTDAKRQTLPFVGVGGKLGDHPTRALKDHQKSARHHRSIENKDAAIEALKRKSTVNWQLVNLNLTSTLAIKSKYSKF
jgi:hypothetical protein